MRTEARKLRTRKCDSGHFIRTSGNCSDAWTASGLVVRQNRRRRRHPGCRAKALALTSRSSLAKKDARRSGSASSINASVFSGQDLTRCVSGAKPIPQRNKDNLPVLGTPGSEHESVALKPFFSALRAAEKSTHRIKWTHDRMPCLTLRRNS